MWRISGLARWHTLLMIIMMMMMVVVLPSGCAWMPPTRLASSWRVVSRPSRAEFTLSAGKGFGNVPTSESTSKGGGNPTNAPRDDESAATTPVVVASSSTDANNNNNGPPNMNAGQRALAELRRQKAEQRNQELREMAALLETDRQLQQAPAAIPEPVAQRMGQRMILAVGLPLGAALLSFVAFWYLAAYKNIQVQPTLVAGVTIALLLLGLMGITYSVLSASWDEDRDGTLLGTEEFQRNVAAVREGLARSRQNVLLRERLDQVDPDELQRARQALQPENRPDAVNQD